MNSIKLVSFPNKEIVFLIAFYQVEPSMYWTDAIIKILHLCTQWGPFIVLFPTLLQDRVCICHGAMLFVQFYSSCSMEELCSKGKPENE